MESVAIKELYLQPQKYINKAVEVKGWVRTVRNSKTFGFIEVNDGSFFTNVQVVFSQERISNFNEVAKLTVGSSITVVGEVVETPNAKQPFEISAQKVDINGLCSTDYPLQKKRHSFEFLRSIAHLRARTNTFSAVFRIRSLAAYAVHRFFQERGFIYVHTPIITGNDCEGAGEMFRVTTLDLNQVPRDEQGNVDFSKDFFEKEANLTVSGQLAAETYCMAFKNVYTFGPTFRAEKSNTARHAAEFWMIEPEMAFADLKANMKVAEEMVKYIIQYVMEQAPRDMEFFNSFIDKNLFNRLENVVNSSFEQITYTEAINLLKKDKDRFDFPVEWGYDLQTEHERYLTEKIFQKPVFVTDYPKDIKAFYMRMNDDGRTVAAMDLLVPGVGEIIGGSQREERVDFLENRMDELGLCRDDYWWYLELRKYGGVIHSGYGLGFERMIMYMTGMTNIRDVISFPRTTGSAEF